MTEDNYLFATECMNMINNAKKLNININEVTLNKENMICKIKLDNNVMVNMQRDVTYNYKDKEQQDAMEIDIRDQNCSISFMINRNNTQNNLYVSLMRNLEVDRILKIEPYRWFSYSKVTGKDRNPYSKTMINKNMKDKYMHTISAFIKYICKKYNIENVEDGYLVIYQQLGNIVEDMTSQYERKNNKSRKRIK